MPRTKPLSGKEREICHRVREWRNYLRLPLAVVAEMVQVKPSYLASIENARNPLRYSVAYRLLNSNVINIHWLFHGAGPALGRSFAPSPAFLKVGEKVLFSQVYFAFLRFQMNYQFVPGGVLGREMARQWLDAYVTDWLSGILDEDIESFTANLVRAGEGYVGAYSKADPSTIELRRRKMALLRAAQSAGSAQIEKNKEGVDSAVVKHYLTSMRVGDKYWEGLRRRLGIAVGRSGAKGVELAQVFGVSKAAFSQWLTGKTSPTADTTLQLLEWVSAEEAKQITPASAINTREGKQTRKGNDEKSKTGPSRKR